MLTSTLSIILAISPQKDGEKIDIEEGGRIDSPM